MSTPGQISNKEYYLVELVQKEMWKKYTYTYGDYRRLFICICLYVCVSVTPAFWLLQIPLHCSTRMRGFDRRWIAPT